MSTERDLLVAELFAGVGGFRLGLEAANDASEAVKYRVVWSNQWEPSTKTQHASDVYASRFGSEGHSNEDISQVRTREIPDHDLLVGGFPCQDYSVARTLNQAAGLVGKKGVLWWQIHRVLKEKGRKRPAYLLLENVDRLLKSPASQRGRDFAIMLASLVDLGYVVEWRVINAADYGMPQRRRRVFVMGYKRSTALGRRAKRADPRSWVTELSVIAKAFPAETEDGILAMPFSISGDLVEVTDTFNEASKSTPFQNAGIAYKEASGRTIYTFATRPKFQGHHTTLGEVLLPEKEVPEDYFIPEADLEKWAFLKGPKSLERTSRSTGHTYKYAEGGMAFPEPLDRPSRTVVTGEGGRSPSRFKHIVKTASGRYRRLTPVELERLNMFPDNHTAGASEVRRAFLMGNALVVGVVEGIARELATAVAQKSERRAARAQG